RRGACDPATDESGRGLDPPLSRPVEVSPAIAIVFSSCWASAGSREPGRGWTPMSALFREDVMRLGAATQFGEAVFHQPLSLKAVVVSLITVFSSLLLFVAIARIKTTVPVPGHLSPVSGEVQVYAERAGIVRELLVADGDEVSQGQPLAIL